jgi:hypothetical protein
LQRLKPWRCYKAGVMDDKAGERSEE